MNKFLVTLFLVFLLPIYFAQAEGVSFEAALGTPEVTLQNPNGTEAIYSGLSVSGKLYFPIYGSKFFTSNIVFSGRYIDLNNNSSTDSQQETGNHLGFGGGLHFKVYRFTLGYNYHTVKARHFWVGNINNQYTEFDYNLGSYYLGLEFMFSKQFGVSLTYETANANTVIENNDVPYRENTYWLHLRFDTLAPIGRFLGLLFRN